MLPSLTPYWPNGWGGNREAAFWDEKSGEAVGRFIDDVSKWQDHQYAIGTSADTLKVKYRYAGGVLYWKWPLATGTRRTGVTCYHHIAGADAKGGADDDRASLTGSPVVADDETLKERDGKELPMFLRIRYADIGLNRVKDWALTYPAEAERPHPSAPKGRAANARCLHGSPAPLRHDRRHFWNVSSGRAAGHGLLGRAGLHPLLTRDVRRPAGAGGGDVTVCRVCLRGEEFSPIETMLGGHPNFMADLKFPIAAAAYLFPDHPQAREWRDEYVKFLS